MRLHRCLILLGSVLLAACGSSNTAQPEPRFVKLDARPLDVIEGKLQVTGHRLDNEKGLVRYQVELRNYGQDPVAIRLHVRFFDTSFATEYEKFPAIHDISLKPGESRRITGTVDFRGLPQRDQISQMGLSVGF